MFSRICQKQLLFDRGKITVNDIMRNCGEVLRDVFEIIMKPACSLLRLEYWIRTS